MHRLVSFSGESIGRGDGESNAPEPPSCRDGLAAVVRRAGEERPQGSFVIVERVVRLMLERRLARLDFSERGALGHRADGRPVSLPSPIDDVEGPDLLAELVPRESMEEFAGGGPVSSEVQVLGGSVRVSALLRNGKALIQLELVDPAAAHWTVAPLSGQTSWGTQLAGTLATRTIDPARLPSGVAGPAAPAVRGGPSHVPRSVPESLTWSEPATTSFTALMGLALGVVTAVAANVVRWRGTRLADVFELGGVRGLAAFGITCSFFWGLALCGARWLRLRDVEAVSDRSLLEPFTAALRSTELAALLAWLESPVTAVSPLLGRLKDVLGQWAIRPSFRDACLVLEQHAAADAAAARDRHRIVRAVVRAPAVIGLAGAALELASALGDAAGIGALERGLLDAARGLSSALTTALEGLLASLLVGLLASALAAREERLSWRVGREVSSLFLPALQRAVPDPQAGKLDSLIRSLEELREAMKRSGNLEAGDDPERPRTPE